MAIKIYKIDPSHDFSWIENSVECNSIAEADFIYIGGHNNVPLILNKTAPITDELHDLDYNSKYIYNVITTLPDNKNIIAVDQGAILTASFLGESFVNYTSQTRSISISILNNIVIPIKCCNQYIVQPKRIHQLDNLCNGFNQYAYNPLKSYYPVFIWKYKRILGIHTNPEMLNKISSKTISVLNKLIKDTYENH